MKKNRRDFEKEIFAEMVLLYCHHHGHARDDVHKSAPEPCSNCREIIDYGIHRINVCKFGDAKKFCSQCTVHCFRPDMRSAVQQIMRFSGPRMIFHHPGMVIKHLMSV